MISLDAFFDHVRPETPGCPNPTVRGALRQAAIEFCERTHIWQETLDPQPVIAGVSEYEVEPSLPATRVVALLSMRTPERLLCAITQSELDDTNPNWRSLTGAPWCFVQENPTTFKLAPTPTETVDAGLIDIRAALAPTQDALEVSELLYEEYAEALSYGTLERLLRMPGQAWSQPQLAMEYRARFALAKSQARVRVRQSYGVARVTVRPRRLAGAP